MPATPAVPNRQATTRTFDYSVLPSSVQDAVREQTNSIHGLLAKTTANVVQVGLRLQFVRNRLGREHFQPWLKHEFRWSAPTASNYMRAARVFGELDCLGQFQPSALFVLARKKCLPAARDEAIRRARQGERITKRFAVELSEQFTPLGDAASAPADRLRRHLMKSLDKLSADQVEMLAQELLGMAERMRARQ